MHKDGYMGDRSIQGDISAIYNQQPVFHTPETETHSTPMQTSNFNLSSTSVQALIHPLVTHSVSTLVLHWIIRMESF